MAKKDQNERGDETEVAERLVAFLEAVNPATEDNRRTRERSAYFRKAEVFLLAQTGQPCMTAFTRNISTGGLSLLTRRPFNVGERFAVKLTLGEGAGKYLLCRTTMCRYLSEGMCEVGAAFEGSAPCLNENHRIPADWVAKATGRA